MLFSTFHAIMLQRTTLFIDVEDGNEPNRSLIPLVPPNLLFSPPPLRNVTRTKRPATEMRSNGNGSKKIRTTPIPMKNL
jgi:hypothetical protein